MINLTKCISSGGYHVGWKAYGIKDTCHMAVIQRTQA